MPTLVTTSGKADRVLLSLQGCFEESQALLLDFTRHARAVSLLPGRIRSLHMFGNRWVRRAEAVPIRLCRGRLKKGESRMTASELSFCPQPRWCQP